MDLGILTISSITILLNWTFINKRLDYSLLNDLYCVQYLKCVLFFTRRWLLKKIEKDLQISLIL